MIICTSGCWLHWARTMPKSIRSHCRFWAQCRPRAPFVCILCSPIDCSVQFRYEYICIHVPLVYDLQYEKIHSNQISIELNQVGGGRARVKANWRHTRTYLIGTKQNQFEQPSQVQSLEEARRRSQIGLSASSN